MDSVNAKMTNDASFNSLMLHQMSTTQLFQSSIDGLHDTTMAEQSTAADNSQVPGMPSFVVGLNNLVNDVKQILFQNGVNIVGVEGMGGSGKTTLALALCNDFQVKGKNNSPFNLHSKLPFYFFILVCSAYSLYDYQISSTKQYSFHYCFTVSKCKGSFGNYVG
jgi:replicative DNA helicase